MVIDKIIELINIRKDSYSRAEEYSIKVNKILKKIQKDAINFVQKYQIDKS